MALLKSGYDGQMLGQVMMAKCQGQTSLQVVRQFLNLNKMLC